MPMLFTGTSDNARLGTATAARPAPASFVCRGSYGAWVWLVRLLLALTVGSLTAEAGIVAGPVTSPVNGHTYYLLASNTWTASEAEAVTLGGHLATIRSAAENEWVYQTFAAYSGRWRTSGWA